MSSFLTGGLSCVCLQALVKTAKKPPAKKKSKKLRLNSAQRKDRVRQKMATFQDKASKA